MRATILEEILQTTRAELARRRRLAPIEELERQVQERRSRARVPARPTRFGEALTRDQISVIAEFKRRSPSAGELRAQADLAAIVDAYDRAGAAAVSVLTEEPHFGGSLQDLAQARACTELPLLRKDFIVDPYQLLEACLAGADAVLLIAAALDGAQLERLRELATTLGLEALVEVHDRAELDLALCAGAQLIGINNRDLRDFSVDTARTVELMAAMPAGVRVVSESGISSAQQLTALEALGVSAVLVGELLMRASDPAAALHALRSRAGALGTEMRGGNRGVNTQLASNQ